MPLPAKPKIRCNACRFDSPLSAGATLHLAGRIFLDDRKLSAKLRARIVADFLVAAPTFYRADELITRDRNFYRRYFSKLKITHVGPDYK